MNSPPSIRPTFRSWPEPDLCGACICADDCKLVVPNSRRSSTSTRNWLRWADRPESHFRTTPFRPILFDSNAVPYLNCGNSAPANVAGQDKNITNVSNPIDVRDDVVRIDHKFNDKWTILGHYMDDKVTQGYAQPELGWLWASYNTVTSTLSNPSNTAAIKLSGTINPNLLVEASINYDGNVINILNSAKLADLPVGLEPVTPFFTHRQSVSARRATASATLRHGRRHRIRSMAQRRPRLRAQGRHLVHHGQARHEVRLQLQPLHQEPAALRRCRGRLGLKASSPTTASWTCCLGYLAATRQYQADPIRHYVNQTPSAYAHG